MAQKRTLMLDGEAVETEIAGGPDGLRVRVGETWHDVDFEPTGRHGLYSLLVDGRSWEVYAQARPGGWDILIGNRVFAIDSVSGRGGRRGSAPTPTGAWVLRSPLAGIVAEIPISVGDPVRAGQVLVVVESMKMKNELTAAREGAVTEITAQLGQRVERGAALVRVE